MPKGDTNEGKLCELTAKVIATSMGHCVTETNVPDTEIRDKKAVDWFCRIGSRGCYIEHTLVEPFPRAIEYGHQFDSLAKTLEGKLESEAFPPGDYSLIFDLAPTNGLHSSKHSALADKIVVWLRDQLRDIHSGISRNFLTAGEPIEPVEKVVDAATFRLAGRLPLDWSSSTRGRILVTRARPEDLEEQRNQRIRAALEKKMAKLIGSGSKDDLKVLILEFHDPALSSIETVCAALKQALRSTAQRPDHIFIWNTTTSNCWQYCRPIAEGDWIEMPEAQQA